MDFSTIMPLISLALAAATFVIGRITASHASGKEAGSLATDVKYIKKSVERMEVRLEELPQVAQMAASAIAKADRANKRIDEHLATDHNYKVEKRD